MGRRLRFSLWLFLLAVCLALGLPAWAQEADLTPLALVLQPVTGEPGTAFLIGTEVRLVGTIRNEGTAPAGEFWVEFSWRRVDKAEACCLERALVPAGLAPGSEVSLEVALDTADLTPGSYEVVLRIDPDDRVRESDETDNRRSAILVVLSSRPELHPISLEVNPSSPVERGETVLVSTEIENTGESTAGEFRVRFLYWQGEIGASLAAPETSWVQFGSALVPGLGRDGRLRIEQPLDTLLLDLLSPELGTITPHTIRVVVDAPDNVSEEDPDNNEMIGSLGVLPSDLSLPELRPVALTFDRDLPLAWGNETSEEVTATVTVVNFGGSTAPGSRENPIVVRFAFRRLGELAWTDIPADNIRPVREDIAIEEGRNSVEATVDLVFDEPGSYEVMADVDPGNLIAEQNEGNNRIVVGLSVQGSELHPLGVEVGSAPVRQGDAITVVSLVENTGEKTATAFTVGFYIDTLRFDTFSYTGEGLERDDSVKAEGVLQTTDLPPGPYTLRVVVDPDDRVAELDEANNVISTPLALLPPVARRAELHPTSLILDPPSPIPAGVGVRVVATLWNTGAIDAERFQVALAYSPDHGVSWIRFSVEDVPSIARGERRAIEGWLPTSSLAAGARYTLRVLVDSSAQVEEEDETNNALLAGLFLGVATTPSSLGADLTASDLVFTPPSPIPQRMEVRVCAEVSNTGQQAVGGFSVGLSYRTDLAGTFIPFATESVPGLAAGRSVTVCRTLDTRSLPLGSIEVKAVADSAGQVAEADEANNERTRTIYVGATSQKPDLSPTAWRIDPPSPVEQGVSALVCVKVANLGAGSAGSFSVSYAYLATSYVSFATATVAGLAGGQTVEVCRALDTSSLAPGTYAVRMTIDPDQRVPEQNEDNNELSAYFTLTVPPKPSLQALFRSSGVVRLFSGDVGNGTVYAASDDGKLYALNHDNASLAGFPFSAGSAIRALALDTGSVRTAYLGTANGELVAVGLDSGLEIRRTSLGEEVLALDVDQFGNVYAGTAARLVSLTRTGGERWAVALAGAARDLIVDRVRSAAYVSTSTGSLVAVSTSGAPKWQADLGVPLTALALGEAIYVGTEDGNVRAVSPGGTVGAGFTAGGAVSGLTVDSGRSTGQPVYATSADGKLYALDRSLRLQWTATSGAPIRAAARVDPRSGLVAFGSDDGKLYVVNPDGSAAFTASVGSPIRSSPWIDALVERTGTGVVLKRAIRFGTEDKTVYRLVTRL